MPHSQREKKKTGIKIKIDSEVEVWENVEGKNIQTG